MIARVLLSLIPILALAGAAPIPAKAGDESLASAAACAARLAPDASDTLTMGRAAVNLPFDAAVRSLYRSIHAEFPVLSMPVMSLEEFMAGGAWQQGEITIRILRAEGPRRLALEFIQSMGKGGNRRLVTEAGLTESAEGAVVFQVRRLWQRLTPVKGSLAGDRAPEPYRIRSAMLRALISAGGAAPQPRIYAATEAEQLAELILHNGTGYPVVYVSAREREGTPFVDPAALADRLGGMAMVVSESEPLRGALEGLLPREALAWDGSIRVYGLAGAGHGDKLQLTRTQVQRLDVIDTAAQVARLAVPLLAASDHGAAAGEARSVVALEDELHEASPEAALARAQQDRVAAEQRVAELEGELRSAQADLAAARGEAEERDARVQSLGDTIASLNRELAEAHASVARISQVPPAPAGGELSLAALFEALGALPETPAEVVAAAERLFGGRLAFTERAHRSARDTGYTDVPRVWKAMVAMASTLYDIYFNARDSVNVESEFQRRTGFELAMGEGSETNRSSRLSALRQDTYLGRAIDVSPHVKLGRKAPANMRIHYYVDRETRRIVISHVGDHLETLGDQRM